MTQRQRAAKLRRYRLEQMRLAYERDGGICRRCGRVGGPPHHVYGHAATWDAWERKHEEREGLL